jgi:hypothetical protein
MARLGGHNSGPEVEHRFKALEQKTKKLEKELRDR